MKTRNLSFDASYTGARGPLTVQKSSPSIGYMSIFKLGSWLEAGVVYELVRR